MWGSRKLKSANYWSISGPKNHRAEKRGPAQKHITLKINPCSLRQRALSVMKHGEPSVLGFHFVEQEVWIQLSPPAPPVAPGKGTYVRRSISLRISRTIKFIFRRPQTVLLTPQRKFIVAHRPERLNSGPHLNCYPSVTNCVFQRSTGSATATRNLAAAEQQSDKPGKSSSPVKSPLHKGCRTEQSREKITACILFPLSTIPSGKQYLHTWL